MRLRGVLIAVWIAAVSGCDDGAPEEPSSAPSAPTLAGSCNFEAAQRCDEYSEAQAGTGTPGACASAGGVWASHQCPLDARAVVCLESAPATRTYAYGPTAATEVGSACPDGKLVEFEGACNRTMQGQCDEVLGADAAKGGAAGRCRMASGTWEAAGRCAMEGRTASCVPNDKVTATYAYDAAAADMLSTSCLPDNFMRIGEAPPPEMPDEDAGT